MTGDRRDPVDDLEDERPDAPPGLFLSKKGNWFHDGQRVGHRRLEALLTGAITRRDGALIVTTGRDALPFVAEDAPFFVVSVDVAAAVAILSDGSREELTDITVGDDERLRMPVKKEQYWALFTRAAVQVLAPYVEENAIALPQKKLQTSAATASSAWSDPPGARSRSPSAAPSSET